MRLTLINNILSAGRKAIVLAAGVTAFWGWTQVSYGAELIEAGTVDYNVIPDKYNAGALGDEFTVFNFSESNIVENKSGEQFELFFTDLGAINLEYKNADLNGTFEFENIDFSNNGFIINGEVAYMKNNSYGELHFIFKNCIFDGFTCCRCDLDDERISYEFENCTFRNFSGSNARFKRCKFGGGVSDGINPFNDTYFEDCYVTVSDTAASMENEVHIDGTQIYGNAEEESKGIYFYNCRFEMPCVAYENAPNAYVNACIMLQLEYNSGSDMVFENCILNGGGYAVYANTTRDEFSLSNVSFKNIQIGAATRYGLCYPKVDANVELNFDTWSSTDSIYIGTVTRDEKSKTTSLCVTNDSGEDHFFRVYTSGGNSYDYYIKACPLGSDKAVYAYSDYPIDVIYTVPEYCDWIVCYELINDGVSLSSQHKQIRFQNWTDSEVEIDLQGHELDWSIDDGGNLIISGMGAMPDFESAEDTPWYEYRDEVKGIIIADTVTTVGNNSFAGLDELESVKVGAIVTKIGENAFSNCSSLSEIILPAKIRTVEAGAFGTDEDAADTEIAVRYEGTATQWMGIVFRDELSNPMAGRCGKLYTEGTELLTELVIDESITVVPDYCFINCESLSSVTMNEKLYSLGNKSFSGTSIKDIVIPDSVKKYNPKVFENCRELKRAVLGTGCTSISVGMFSNCEKLEEVLVTDELVSIGISAFQGCSGLKSFDFPESIESVGQNAFCDCSSLVSVELSGNVTWGKYMFSGASSLSEVKFTGKWKGNLLETGFFKDCVSLRKIDLPSDLKELKNCFSGCVSLEEITIPAVESIASNTFENCTALKSVYIKNGVKSICRYAFFNCSALEKIYIPKSVVSIYGADKSNTAFKGCNTEMLIYTPLKKPAATWDSYWNYANTKEIKVFYGANKECFLGAHDYHAEFTWSDDLSECVTTVSCKAKDSVLVEEYPCDIQVEGSGSALKYSAYCDYEGYDFKETKKVDLKKKATGFDELTSQDKGVAEVSLRENDIFDGYQIKYSTSSNFKKNVVSIAVSDKKQTNFSIDNLECGRVYYMKARCYKEIDGDTLVYSAWTGTKKVTIMTQAPVPVINSMVSAYPKTCIVEFAAGEPVAGYEVEYSLNKKFGSGSIGKVIPNGMSTCTSLGSMKSGKKYYIRVRSYIYIDDEKSYSLWSDVKSINVK